MSFILIGFGKKTFNDLGETGQEQRCCWCSSSVFYHLITMRTWFTCFFIPVYSYRNEYRLECPNCAQGVWIHGEEIKAAKQGELRIHTWTVTVNKDQPEVSNETFE